MDDRRAKKVPDCEENKQDKEKEWCHISPILSLVSDYRSFVRCLSITCQLENVDIK
jgi:hypothetical protein